MTIKKSKLYSSLWKSCDELRGSMDASQYKDYVLTLLFVKYVSDKHGGNNETGIKIPKGGSFDDMVKLKHTPEIGSGINDVIRKLTESIGLKGVINIADFNNDEKLGKGKAKVDRLSNLISIFEFPELDFSKNQAGGDDLLGDAYEYLMKHFAVDSGKSKGHFYTPAEVSRIMAKVIGVSETKSRSQTVYDPTCGSGSLLLKAAYETKTGITIYGQEKDNSTKILADMNLWLHGYPGQEIYNGDTISDPHFKNSERSLKQFDFVVANPPFSTKSWSSGIDPDNDLFNRFDLGTPPKKNGDYAFLLHLIKSLKETGKAAIILPHGVLFRGNVEADIRKNILNKGLIKGIIGLPSNLFYGTGIPACIIIIDKEDTGNRKGIFMIDASKGFSKDGNKNRLRSRDIHKIVDVFTNQIDIPKYSRMVPLTEISNEKNDYNLNIPRYIDTQEEEDLQDIEAHLKGGIPKRDIDGLENYWMIFPTLRTELFKPSKRKEYVELNVPKEEIKNSILTHPEYNKFQKKILNLFNEWKKRNNQVLTEFKIGSKPKEAIHTISEDILSTFSKADLIDNYGVYQDLMTYWSEIMQDDTYMINVTGWNSVIEPETNSKGKEIGWFSPLIPKDLAIKKYFRQEQESIDELQSELESISQQKETLEEENSGEEDMFSEARSAANKITKGELTKRVKIIKNDEEFADELKLLLEYSGLLEKETKIKTEIKEKTQELDKQLYTRYKSFSEAEVKEIVIDDKWMNQITVSLNSEMDSIAQKLTSRIKTLAERYEKPLPQLTTEVEELTQKVDKHLQKMGFKW